MHLFAAPFKTLNIFHFSRAGKHRIERADYTHTQTLAHLSPPISTHIWQYDSRHSLWVSPRRQLSTTLPLTHYSLPMPSGVEGREKEQKWENSYVEIKIVWKWRRSGRWRENKTKQMTQMQSLTSSHEQTDAQAVPEQNMANLPKSTLLLSEHDIIWYGICLYQFGSLAWHCLLPVPCSILATSLVDKVKNGEGLQAVQALLGHNYTTGVINAVLLANLTGCCEEN